MLVISGVTVGHGWAFMSFNNEVLRRIAHKAHIRRNALLVCGNVEGVFVKSISKLV